MYGPPYPYPNLPCDLDYSLQKPITQKQIKVSGWA